MTQANLDDQHAKQSADGTWLILKTPDYDTTANVRTSYLRLGGEIYLLGLAAMMIKSDLRKPPSISSSLV